MNDEFISTPEPIIPEPSVMDQLLGREPAPELPDFIEQPAEHIESPQDPQADSHIDYAELIARNAELEAQLSERHELDAEGELEDAPEWLLEGTDIADDELQAIDGMYMDLPYEFRASPAVTEAFGRFTSTGFLTEEDLTALTREGFDRGEVIEFIDSAKFVAGGGFDSYTTELVGSPEAYRRMMEWAKTSLSREQIEHFNRMIDASTLTAEQAIGTLWDEYKHHSTEMLRSEQPRVAFTVSHNPPVQTTPQHEPFASEADRLDAFRNPLYRTDANYRSYVEARLRAN